jgi:hypothetical protein
MDRIRQYLLWSAKEVNYFFFKPIPLNVENEGFGL